MADLTVLRPSDLTGDFSLIIGSDTRLTMTINRNGGYAMGTQQNLRRLSTPEHNQRR
ncbi:hypothetical protein [Mycobacterium mantenii]|uniref:hypothetical protein n=1 Tax=Mycobacterium mantenii TaxID=560555 RepID=UPI001E4CAE4F|nr:hypothetical protein [Mycobacterium mantenii]